jgi:hypothetical protein
MRAYTIYTQFIGAIVEQAQQLAILFIFDSVNVV